MDDVFKKLADSFYDDDEKDDVDMDENRMNERKKDKVDCILSFCISIK